MEVFILRQIEVDLAVLGYNAGLWRASLLCHGRLSGINSATMKNTMMQCARFSGLGNHVFWNHCLEVVHSSSPRLCSFMLVVYLSCECNHLQIQYE